MIKRLIDIFFSGIGLFILSPVLTIFCVLVWLNDFKSPFYIANRIGKDGKPFNMVKIRSMIHDANKTGVVSTSSNDTRITKVGSFVRKYKIDEISQLWNVLIGDMSLVGPRPNVIDEVNLYTDEEKALLSVKPGITDFSSIVFSDLNEILSDSKNPNLDYNQFVRPWKSRLGLFYVSHASTLIDVKVIMITIVSLFNREYALKLVNQILTNCRVEDILVNMARRQSKLVSYPPPGSDKVVTNR